MRRLVRIADTRNGIFATMPEVLAALPAEVRALSWRILDLGEVVLKDESTLDLAGIEEQVFASPEGLAVSFGKLEAFADRTRQVVDGLFVATAEPRPSVLRSDDDATIIERSLVVVAAFDSTYWLVSGSDHVLAHLSGLSPTSPTKMRRRRRCGLGDRPPTRVAPSRPASMPRGRCDTDVVVPSRRGHQCHPPTGHK